MQRNVVCFGKLIIDIIMQFAKFPTRGEVTFCKSEYTYGGGGAFNVLMNIAGLDHAINTFAFAHVGSDEHGAYITELLRSRKINTDFLMQSVHKTPHTVVISEKQESVRSFLAKDTPIDDSFDFKEFTPILTNMPKGGIFYVGYLNNLPGMEIKDSKFDNLYCKLFHHIKQNDYIIIADCASMGIDQSLIELVNSTIKYLDVLVLNEIEFGNLLKKNFRNNKKQVLHKLLKQELALYSKSTNSTIVVHFPEGAYFSAEDKIEFVKSFAPQEIKGSVGAGDAFCSGLIVGILDSLDWAQTITQAHAVAYFNLQSELAVGPAVKIDQIRTLIKESEYKYSNSNL